MQSYVRTPGFWRAAVSITVLASAFFAAPARAQTVALSDGFTLRAELSSADVGAYLRAFDLQERGQIGQAAGVISQIENPVLLGYVEFQKYMHPTAYRSSYSELRNWLASYNDLPEADRIHRLAERRQAGDTAGPQAPVRHAPPAFFGSDGSTRAATMPGLSSEQRRAVSRLKSRIRARIADGWPTGARTLIAQEPAGRNLSAGERIEIAREISRAYFRAGKFDLSLAESDLAWLGGAPDAPLIHWWGGLAAWRLDQMEDAQRHFTALAAYQTESPWILAAAGYWAGRSYLAGRRPDRVNEWLQFGAAFPYTFYGILSRRALGYPLSYDWTPPPIDPGLVDQIVATPYGARAVALIQLGMTQEAERELTHLAGAERELVTTIMALAARADMPALTKRLSGTDPETTLAAAMYPVPSWRPNDGFSVDRALIYAFMRQESAFRHDAESRSGARGLMQLMPATASFVAQDRSLRGAALDRLYEPGFNMQLGQRYIANLLASSAVNADLFKLAVAYNAGPGNMARWFEAAGSPQDSLLFIESLPARQTRIFVERVLANFWIYRDRLGQPTPSLSAAASGNWPTLVALDHFNPPVASSDTAPRHQIEQ